MAVMQMKVQASTQVASRDDTCSPSPSSTDYLHRYQENFTEFNSAPSSSPESRHDEFTLLPFEDEEYEDSYTALRQREKKLILHDHICDYSKLPVFGILVLEQRHVMVEWMVEVWKMQSLEYETLFLGVTLFDRFLAKGYFKTESSMEVLGIACLRLAAKIEENQCSGAMIRHQYFVGENEYCYLEVIGMEWLVQEVLEFHCFVPTVYNFLEYYLKAAKADVKLQNMARYMALLSLADHRRLAFSPSTVAAGLVMIASLALNQESSCQSVMKTHLRTSKDQLQICIHSLEVCLELDNGFQLEVLFEDSETCELLSPLMELAGKGH